MPFFINGDGPAIEPVEYYKGSRFNIMPGVWDAGDAVRRRKPSVMKTPVLNYLKNKRGFFWTRKGA